MPFLEGSPFTEQTLQIPTWTLSFGFIPQALHRIVTVGRWWGSESEKGETYLRGSSDVCRLSPRQGAFKIKGRCGTIAWMSLESLMMSRKNAVYPFLTNRGTKSSLTESRCPQETGPGRRQRLAMSLGSLWPFLSRTPCSCASWEIVTSD